VITESKIRRLWGFRRWWRVVDGDGTSEMGGFDPGGPADSNQDDNNSTQDVRTVLEIFYPTGI
jgi:hypothetical protein